MKIIDKDILTVDQGIICQVVNCKGVMGAGLALQIRKKWPIAYIKYKDAFENNNFELGTVQIVSVRDNLFIINLYAQNDYGRQNKVYINYGALRKCFKSIATLIESAKQLNIISDVLSSCYIPYKIGCGLAGGDWSIVKNIIREELPEAIICKLNKSNIKGE